MAKKELNYVVNVKTKGAVDSTDKLNKGLKGVEDQSKKTAKSTSELTGKLDGATGGAVSKFASLKGTLSTVITSFKSLKVAIIGTGIGALVIGLVALSQAFKRSEEGQNKLAKGMAILGAIFDNIMDVVANLGTAIINALESPGEAFKKFKQLLKDNIETRIEGLLNLVPSLGKAIELVFKGKFKEAGKVAVDSLGKVTLGVDSVTDAIKNAQEAVADFIEETSKEGKKAGAIADARANADRIERKLKVDRAKADRDRADLLEKAVNKEKFSLEERIGFLTEAGKLEEEITNKEIEVAKIRLNAQRAENALGLSNKEAKDAEADLNARAIQLETAKLRKAKLVTSQISALRNQEAAEAKALTTEANKSAEEQTKKEEEDLKKKQESLQAIKDEFTAKVEDSEAETEIEKIELEYERHLAKLEALQVGLDEENEIYKAAELEKARILGYYTDKIRKEEEKNLKEAADFKEKQYKDTFSKLQNILTAGGGAMEKISKGLAIADVVRTSYKSISSTVSNTAAANAAAVAASPLTVGQPWVATNTIKAGLDIATTLATAKKSVSAIIGSSKSIGSRPSMSTGGGGAGAQASSYTPEKSVAQLIAESNKDIATNGQKPMRAYVVSGDVTTAQSMERNIVDGASI